MITWMQKHRKYLVVTIWVSTIAFVGAGFVGWGAYDLNVSRASSVAKVGHRNISIQEFQNRYGQLHAYYNQLFDGQLSEKKASELGIENLALEELVNDALLLNFADDLGLGVNDEDIVKYIVADQNFYVNGKFDKELYKNTLKRARITESEYEDSLKNVILLDKLRHALNLPAKEQDINMLTASFLMQDKISMQVVEAATDEIKIDEDAVKKLWEERKNDYKTMTEFKLDTKFIPTISSDANTTELMEFYNENKNEYKGSDDKIKEFEAVKDEVLKDYNLKQTKKVALEEYLKIKKDEKQADVSITTLEDNASLPIDELKLAKKGDTLKPFEYEDGYMIVKVKEIVAPRVMSFDEAKDQILELYKEQKTQETVEAKAKELLEKGFQGTDIGFISRDTVKAESGLSEGEFNIFVNRLFEKSGKKGYVSLGNKAVVYEITEQKLFNGEKEKEYKEIITQNVGFLKNNELIRDLSGALSKRYKVEYYVSKK